jgi:hypothetical protein
MKMEVADVSETVAPISKTTWPHVAGDHVQHMPTHRHDKRHFYISRISFSPRIRRNKPGQGEHQLVFTLPQDIIKHS